MTTASSPLPAATTPADNAFEVHGWRWAPGERRSCTPAEAAAYLHRLTTEHYENFSVLSGLVPPGLRPDFAAVYGYCRWADDLADETGSGEAAKARSMRLLSAWRAELDGCFAFARGVAGAEAPAHPVFVALAETAKRRPLSPEPFHHLVDAFEQDQRVTRYRTWDEVIGYCRCSADPVGRIVLALAGHDGSRPGDAERIAMSDATCTALQLTNFWQDVRRDLLERDRVYMPERETGITGDMLREWLSRENDPGARAPFIKALRGLVRRTWPLFERGRALPRTLARDIGPVVWLFGAGGESVLRSVERIGCATLWERPRLSKGRKAWLVARAWAVARMPISEKMGA